MYSRSRGILYTAPPAADDVDADAAEADAPTESTKPNPNATASAETGESPADD